MFPETLPSDPRERFTAAEIFDLHRTALGFTEKNYSRNMHSQEFFEINVVLSGSGMHYVGNGRLEASAGDVYIIPPQLRHGYLGSEGFDVYHLLLSPAFLEKYSSDLMQLPAFFTMFRVEPAMRERYRSDLRLKLTEEELAELMPTLEEIAADSKRTDPASALTVACRSLILIATLCTRFDRSMKDRRHSDAIEDEAFMRSIAMIYEKASEKLTIEALASAAQMSRSAYLRRFREFTGETPGEYVLKRRLEGAANMLENTVMTVNDIAVAQGFYDASHLIRAFTARYGASPMEYRRGHQSL